MTAHLEFNGRIMTFDALNKSVSVGVSVSLMFYNHIAGISTVLAALMTTVCVVGMKLGGNQQKVDQSVDWLKRIWIAWAIINGIGAFLAYVRPLLDGLATIKP